jgi:hypothetical protein
MYEITTALMRVLRIVVNDIQGKRGKVRVLVPGQGIIGGQGRRIWRE